MKNNKWVLYLFEDKDKSDLLKIMEFRTIKDIAFVLDMEQQIRDTAKAVQRIIKKALNNIRTGLIKRIMGLFKIFAAIGKRLNPLNFFLGPAAQKELLAEKYNKLRGKRK